jgi:uncharacterized protein YutE (UPF0331/DUF86 family)
MSPSKVSRRIVLDRIAWVDRMLKEIQSLPVADRASFLAESRNVWAAESCLRRAIEALFDIGRHILARGFGRGDVEYREIADGLGGTGVLDPPESTLMRMLAGYRNRLVHFYHEVSADELFDICTRQLDDLSRIRGAYHRWVESHPGMIDTAL